MPAPQPVRVRRLQSRFFRGNERLEACLVEDRARIRQGETGLYVEKIQVAIFVVDLSMIDRLEVLSKHYGPSTASAVLRYKKKRRISELPAADTMVGKTTMDRLDREIRDYEAALLMSEMLGN
jgi:hypothetical protein